MRLEGRAWAFYPPDPLPPLPAAAPLYFRLLQALTAGLPALLLSLLDWRGGGGGGGGGGMAVSESSEQDAAVVRVVAVEVVEALALEPGAHVQQVRRPGGGRYGGRDACTECVCIMFMVGMGGVFTSTFACWYLDCP